MFVIRETLRVARALLGYGLRGGRVGLVVALLACLVALALAGTATVTVPIALYPFL